jgi:hypothetical protein
MRLAAAKSRLKLDDRLTALTNEPLSNLREQKPHTLSDEGTVKEGNRILVLARSLPCMYRRDIGGELRLLEGPFQNVAVRNSNFSPG